MKSSDILATMELTKTLTPALEKLRDQLSQREALPQLALLGILIGVISGLIIILFSWIIHIGQALFIGQDELASFASLPWWGRLALPLAGAALLGWLFRKGIPVGVVHVMERLDYHQARMPFKNAAMQLVGASIAIISGQSMGREGPSVHLGAYAASLTGHGLKLPHNSLRTLLGCGIAGAIGASFNTPLAGVIFAIEVVLLEYSVVSMAPIILASVVATAIAQTAFSEDIVFQVPTYTLGSVGELPFLLICGFIIGCMAAGFNHTAETVAIKAKPFSIPKRFLFAGAVTAAFGVLLPEVMGLGQSAINQALSGNLTLTFCISLMLLKLIASGVSVGCGMPAGLIGPSLVIGAAGGCALGLVGAMLFGDDHSHPGFYALLGMTAMMGAVLQAPLAALTAILELTGNPHMLMPGMLVVIAAMMTNRQLFKKRPIFLSLMRLRGLDYRHDALSQHLRGIGVAGVMEKQVKLHGRWLLASEGKQWLDKMPGWILVLKNEQEGTLVPGAAVATAVAREYQPQDAAESGNAEPEPAAPADADNVIIDLLEIPAEQRQKAVAIDLDFSLQEALDHIEGNNAEAAFVVRPSNRYFIVDGVLTDEMIGANLRDNR